MAESKPPVLRPPSGGSGVSSAGSGWDWGPPRAIVTRRGRWRWSVRVEHGPMKLRGPSALTRRRAEAKGRRMLARYLAERSPEEYEVDP